MIKYPNFEIERLGSCFRSNGGLKVYLSLLLIIKLLKNSKCICSLERVIMYLWVVNLFSWNLLCLYFFSFFKTPPYLELSIFLNLLLWGGSEVARKIHRVKWETIYLSKENEDLKVQTLTAYNHVLLDKWCWRCKGRIIIQKNWK